LFDPNLNFNFFYYGAGEPESFGARKFARAIAKLRLAFSLAVAWSGRRQ
jgi:hypothetical protein